MFFYSIYITIAYNYIIIVVKCSVDFKELLNNL